MVLCDFFRLHFKLLQAVHLVVEKLFDSPGIYTFKLVEDAENHIEFALRDVRLCQHILHLPQAYLAILPFSFAVFEQLG